jgi:hypothetical protein
LYPADIRSVWRRCLVIVFFSALVPYVPVCAADSDKVLKITPGDDAAIQYMPGEITAMLEDLGYEWVPVHDSAVGHGLKVAQQNGQYRMQFRASDAAGIIIDVHMRISDNVTGLYFHDAADVRSAASLQERYRKLRERLSLEFGAENVSEGHSFLTP